MRGFKKREIKLATKEKKLKTIGLVKGGFGIHRTFAGHTEGVPDFSTRTWTITHLKTGRAIKYWIANLNQAKTWVTQLIPLTDWDTMTVAKWKRNKMLQDKAWEVLVHKGDY